MKSTPWLSREQARAYVRTQKHTDESVLFRKLCTWECSPRGVLLVYEARVQMKTSVITLIVLKTCLLVTINIFISLFIVRRFTFGVTSHSILYFILFFSVVARCLCGHCLLLVANPRGHKRNTCHRLSELQWTHT